MIFEMRNTIIISRGRGGVGGLEGVEASRDREQEKENTYEGGCNTRNPCKKRKEFLFKWVI
jgi:hypothetical protein